MRILKATQTYYPYLSWGGQPRAVSGIARALTQRGHEVTVLTADYGEACYVSLHDLKRQDKPWGWQSHWDGVEALYLNSLAKYRATTINPDLLSFCAKRLADYDVVHVYGLYDLIGAVVAWFCRRHNIPYVLEPLGMFRPKIRSQQKKRIYERLIGSGLFSGAEAIIATSETERLELVEGGIASDRIVVRPNGLDLTEFQDLPRKGALRARFNIEETAPLFLFLGRLSFIKGLDLLVEAFAQINTNARLIIVGPDDRDGCLENIRHSIAELNIEDRVILPGPLFGREKIEALVDADVFILPSRHESFGNAAAEAIACGTPVLVTDKCGIAAIVDGRAGIVVACEVKSMREGLARLLADMTLLGQLKEGCNELAQGLSWDEPVRAMECLYELLISRNDFPENVSVATGNA